MTTPIEEHQTTLDERITTRCWARIAGQRDTGPHGGCAIEVETPLGLCDMRRTHADGS